jgi:hypothetical protein
MAYRVAAIAVLCGLAVGSAQAAPAAEDERRYETVWNIQPDPAQLGERRVAIGEPVLEQRLLPIGLAIAEEDIQSASGDVLAEKGTQLFQLDVNRGKAYCVATVPRPSAFRSLMLGGGNLQRCFVDGDGDGRFDGQFNGGNPMRGVPFIEGKLPKTPKPASGRYSTLPPEQFALQYTVRIALTEAKVTASGKTAFSYRIDFGDAQTRQKLTDSIGGALGATDILDARWDAQAVDGKGARLAVTQVMPAQPFQVELTRRYR